MTKLELLEDYFKSNRLSQSALLNFRFHPRFIRSLVSRESPLYYEEKKHFLKGSLLDVLLLTPDIFKDMYHVDSLDKKPTDAVMSIIQEGFDLGINIEDKKILEIARKQEYGTAWSDEVLMSRILDGGTVGKNLIKNLGLTYYKELIEAKGKQIISKEEGELANRVTFSLKNNPLCSWIFNNTDKDLKIEFQYDIRWNHDHSKGVKIPSKALLDILITNDSDKEKTPCEGFIIKPRSRVEIDLKSFSDYIYKFEKNIKKFRYDVQRAWYNEGLRAEDIFDTFNHTESYILAVSFLEPDYPKFFKFSKETMEISEYGDEDLGIMGYREMIDRMLFFEEHGYKKDINEKDTIEFKWE